MIKYQRGYATSSAGCIVAKTRRTLAAKQPSSTSKGSINAYTDQKLTIFRHFLKHWQTDLKFKASPHQRPASVINGVGVFFQWD